MPIVSYFLSTTDDPIDQDHSLWHLPLPDSRLPAEKKSDALDTETVTYGSYFSAVSKFCATDGWDRIIKAASSKLEQPLVENDLQEVSIFLEKHGAFYHPALLQVAIENKRLSFVVNVAASNHGRRTLSREVKALKRLNDQRPFGWFPTVYSSTSDELPMFLGDWFDGFHEFHLTRRPGSDNPVIVVWDGAATRSVLSEKQAADLYRNAAMILTACYDPLTSCQIFPWHHAAGDFVVRVEGDGVTVRLITVRNYLPLSGCAAEPGDERAILEALMIFFIHLSVRMRLDRLDGVSEVAWASDHCLASVADGFLLGLDLTARMSGFPETFPDTFRQFFNHHDGKVLLAMARRITEAVFDQRTEERRLIDRHLVRHIHEIIQLFTA